MLRGAVIGLGNVALAVHLPGWARRRDVDITAVTDIASARRSAVEERLPNARWYDSADELLSQAPLDFIDVCTPPSTHAPLIERALARGLHVLCEKPLVHSPEALARITALAAKRDRVLHTVHNWHHAPIIRQAQTLVREGAIGRVTRIEWATLRTQPAAVRDAHEGNWRLDPALAGGGILTDHGWHVFYLLLRWAGQSPTSVRARLETRRHTAWAVEDTATVDVTFPTATAEVFLTWAADRRENTARLIGTTGRIELEGETLVLVQGASERRWSCPPALSAGSVHPDWFDPVVEQFVGEATRTLPRDGNLAEASCCLELESRARESSRHGGRTIALPSFA
jgi:predicted dehydrogenase